MKETVFISYRRADTSGHAGRISDDLERHFGMPVVFRDIDSIAAGQDFVKSLEQAIDAARVCLVLIGDTWLTEQAADGSRRLDDPNDHVRREIELALARDGLVVLPVLVEGASMPDPDDLPGSLRALARLQAVELSESRWAYDIGRLVEVLTLAGIGGVGRGGAPRWLWPLLAVLIAAVAALGWCCWQDPDPGPLSDYTGLWYQPNGSFWSVREKDGGLWIEETHYESQQVWRRGSGALTDDTLQASLELVFERASFRYLYELRLSPDGHSLIGTIRRSDRDQEQSLVLSRDKS